ncbi:MAG: hypothetical protein KME03_08545 [Aphanocapsa lilacina HA4352-LM1]|nr:hypothetical protein [Aphanocapsa lilacina HA4352-LM1]
MDANEQYAANTEESAGFENSYPIDDADTGDVELCATGADIGNADGEDYPGGLSTHSLEVDSESQAGYAAYSEMTAPQPWEGHAWYGPDAAVHQEEAEATFEVPAADTGAEGAVTLTGNHDVDGWGDMYGGELGGSGSANHLPASHWSTEDSTASFSQSDARLRAKATGRRESCPGSTPRRNH